MNTVDSIHTYQAQSHTAVICENAALYGATPSRDEFDPREVWDEDDAVQAVRGAFELLSGNIAPDGTQLADERESVLWGFVNMLDAQVRRLDRSVDRLAPKLRNLQREQDGSEIKSRELELITDRVQNLGAAARRVREAARCTAADDYRNATGGTWRPRYGSHISHTRKLTSAAIDARDFLRAKKDREISAHLPDGTLIAIAGGKQITSPDAVFRRLDNARAKYTDMVLVHGGGPGVEKHRGAVGGSQRRAPGGVQAGLECARAGRTVSAQRRTAEPAAEGRDRVPGQRHHRQPGGQGHQARHPGAALRGMTASATPLRAASHPSGAARSFLAGAQRQCRRVASPALRAVLDPVRASRVAGAGFAAHRLLRLCARSCGALRAHHFAPGHALPRALVSASVRTSSAALVPQRASHDCRAFAAY